MSTTETSEREALRRILMRLDPTLPGYSWGLAADVREIAEAALASRPVTQSVEPVAWISVKDRLPPVSDYSAAWPRSEYVLCWCEGWTPAICVLQATFLRDGSFAGWVGPQSHSVTHWQPPPSAPEGAA